MSTIYKKSVDLSSSGSTAGAITSQLFDVVSSTVIYLGEAAPGTATSSALWLIKKITISGGSISILCANGSGDYDQIWDDRSALTYV